MRALFTTRGSSGHVGPLAPFARALIAAGHDVLVTSQRAMAGNVERLGLPVAPVDGPAPEQWMPLLGAFSQLSVREAHEVMVAEYFGRIDVEATLPGVRRVAADFRPDLIVRESWDLAGGIVAEEQGIPLARVALGLSSLEEQTVRLMGASRATPYLTTVPEALEDPTVAAQPATFRFANGAPVLPEWWPGDRPLVYATFGTVTAAAHLHYFPDFHRAAIAELADVDARVLLTIGEDRDLSELGPLPANVRVERWAPQDAVIPHAAAVVSHGGYGTTLGCPGARRPCSRDAAVQRRPDRQRRGGGALRGGPRAPDRRPRGPRRGRRDRPCRRGARRARRPRIPRVRRPDRRRDARAAAHRLGHGPARGGVVDVGALAARLAELAAADRFSGVVRVERGGSVLHESAHGLASRAWGIPCSPEHRFDTASITKLFTAVGVLQQVEAGAFSLRTGVAEFLGLAEISPAVTPYHLLTHTSGIADDADEEAGERYEDLFRERPNYAVTETADLLPQFLGKPPNFAPGEGARYCNAGYVLLGLMIERGSGLPFREYVGQRVFAPAGMHRSGFFRMDVAEPGVAEGADPIGGVWRRNVYSYPPIGSPDGGAHVTAADLAGFHAALRAGRLLGPESTRAMLAPHERYRDDLMTGFGFEFAVGEGGAVRHYGKEGVNAGASGELRHYPAEDVTVVVLSNMEDGAGRAIKAL